MNPGRFVKNDRITFVIFTFNEEKRIAWAIKNFINWGRILVVDNFSEDDTVAIARSHGCDVLLNKNKGWVEDHETVLRVKTAVQTDWIYWAFADEFVDEPTLAAMSDAVYSKKYRIVSVVRKNYYYGIFCYDALVARMNRLFEKTAIDFSTNTIHQFGTVVAPKGTILDLDSKRYYVRHFISNDVKTYLRAMDRYTDIESPTSHRGVNLFALGARLARTFLVHYLFKGGYKAGCAGLFLVVQMMYYECLLVMKVYELRHDLRGETIEMANDKVRRSLLALEGD